MQQQDHIQTTLAQQHNENVIRAKSTLNINSKPFIFSSNRASSLNDITTSDASNSSSPVVTRHQDCDPYLYNNNNTNHISSSTISHHHEQQPFLVSHPKKRNKRGKRKKATHSNDEPLAGETTTDENGETITTKDANSIAAEPSYLDILVSPSPNTPPQTPNIESASSSSPLPLEPHQNISEQIDQNKRDRGGRWGYWESRFQQQQETSLPGRWRVKTDAQMVQPQHQQKHQPVKPNPMNRSGNKIEKRSNFTLSDMIAPDVEKIIKREKDKKKLKPREKGKPDEHKSTTATSSQKTPKKPSKDQKKEKIGTNSEQSDNTTATGLVLPKKTKKPNKLKKIILNERKMNHQTKEVETEPPTMAAITTATTTAMSDISRTQDQEKENSPQSEEEPEEEEEEEVLVTTNDQSVPDGDQHEQPSLSQRIKYELEEEKEKKNGPSIREYVNQIVDPELDQTVTQMLTKLKEFQSRLYKNEPKKFKTNRRFVLGLRETQRAISAKKLIAVIVAPNIEKVTSPGGLDSLVSQIIISARQNNIPVIFALSKRKIAKVFARPVNMSIVGLYNANGAYEEYKKMIELASRARDQFEKQREQQEQQQQEQQLEVEKTQDGDQQTPSLVEGK